MPAEKVELTDEVPAGIEFLGASAGGSLVRRSRPALDEVKWALGTLAPGSSRTVRVVLRAKSPGELVNVAAAGADRGLTAKATARTKFEDATGLSAEIDKAADPLDVGQDAVYVVRIINPGKMPARSVTLVVTAPEELQVSSARGPTAADQDRQTVKFAPLDMLRPGAEAEYSLYVRALKPGTAKLRVELTSAETGPTPLTWQEAVTVRAPAEPGAPPSEK
jgi:hypothetical protein